MKHKRLPMPVRVAVMVGAATLLWLMAQSAIDALFGHEYSRQTHVIRAVVIFSLAVPLVLLARRFLDKEPSLRPLGLQPLAQGGKPFVVGMLAWLVPAMTGLALCVLTGIVDISTSAPLGAIAGNLLSLVALVFIFEAFPEELIFRGYVFRNIAQSKAVWLAVALQAVLFTLWGIGNGGEITLDRIVLFAVFGTLLGIIRAITGSVWTTIGYHVAFQAVAQLFGSVGGQFTTEPAAILGLVAFGILPCALSVTVLRRFYPAPIRWQQLEKKV